MSFIFWRSGSEKVHNLLVWNILSIFWQYCMYYISDFEWWGVPVGIRTIVRVQSSYYYYYDSADLKFEYQKGQYKYLYKTFSMLLKADLPFMEGIIIDLHEWPWPMSPKSDLNWYSPIFEICSSDRILISQICLAIRITFLIEKPVTLTSDLDLYDLYFDFWKLHNGQK